MDGSQVLGTAPVAGQRASLSVVLPFGPHTLTAIYNGDFSFLPSTSTTVTTSVTSVIAVGADAGAVGIVNVYDSTTGALKFSVAPFGFAFRGGVRVAVGDLDGNGVQEVICVAGPGGLPLVNIYDGGTGLLIRAFFAFGLTSPASIGNTPGHGAMPFTGGVFVAAGDITGAGYADIIVGADAGASPQVQVFDGKTGNLVANFYAFNAPSFRGGVRVAAGDVSGAGYADIICAAGIGGGPQFTVYDGRSLAPITNNYAFGTEFFTGGLYVAAGDINGDGKADVIIGAGAGGGPEVAAFNVTSQTLLANFYAMPASFTGGVRVGYTLGAGGAGMIVAGAGPGAMPQVTEFDASTLAILNSFYALTPLYTGGLFVA
jgi:hypothetical protein